MYVISIIEGCVCLYECSCTRRRRLRVTASRTLRQYTKLRTCSVSAQCVWACVIALVDWCVRQTSRRSEVSSDTASC